MSITDELRSWAARELASWKMARERFDALTDIVDRIDEAIANEYVRLPKDADGEPIHIGDVMETFACPAQDYRKLVVYAIAECDVMSTENEFFAFNEIRHYHKPTVEDVLREMCLEIDRRCERGGIDYDELFAEYAEKLREVLRDE